MPDDATDRGTDRAADRALLDRLVAGDGEAWERFVLRHQPVIARRVRMLGVPGADVDDVCSAVFEKLFEDGCRRLLMWDGRASLGTFVNAVAANLAKDVVRALRRRGHRADLDAVDLHGAAPGAPVRIPPGPRVRATQAELRELVIECFYRLDNGADREILLLHYYAGLDAATIARLSRRERNAVDQSLHRAKGHLLAVAGRRKHELLELLKDDHDA